MGTVKVTNLEPIADNGTLTVGSSGDTVTFPSGVTVSGLTQGITEADQWRLTANITGDVNPISSNLERSDDATFAKIGTGMSVNSGLWSFPGTGLWWVQGLFYIECVSGDYAEVNLAATANNSSYDDISFSGNYTETAGDGGVALVGSYVNVTNTTNVKVKFYCNDLASGTAIRGSTTANRTYFTFIRLGASQ